MSSRRVIIALKGLGALANHGVYDFERDRSQRFSADIVMWVETAGAADDIAATVSYADIADEAMAVLTGTAVDLIETLAETIASRVMSHEGVVGTEVTVHKPDAPIDHPFADVSVTVRAGQTDAMPLSLSLKGIYEAEDGSVLTGEIEAYGHAQAPSPAEQEQSGALPTRRDVQAAHAAPAHDARRPEHLRSRRVVLAIGGNLGDVPVTLMHTVEALSYMEGFQIDDVSPIMRTKPVLAPGQAPSPTTGTPSSSAPRSRPPTSCSPRPAASSASWDASATSAGARAPSTSTSFRSRAWPPPTRSSLCRTRAPKNAPSFWRPGSCASPTPSSRAWVACPTCWPIPPTVRASSTPSTTGSRTPRPSWPTPTSSSPSAQSRPAPTCVSSSRP